MELIIDELKKENRQLRFKLAAKDEQLKMSAGRVQNDAKSMVQLENALEKAQQHALNFEMAVESKERKLHEDISKLKAS